MSNSFHKAERLCSRKSIEALFAGGNKSFSVYPIRAIYMATNQKKEGEKDEILVNSKTAQVQLLISVSKRHFKHAVDRNRVKRQLREAYRLNKHLLLSKLPEGKTLALAFVWLTSKQFPTKIVEEKVRKALLRVAEGTISQGTGS